MVILNRTMQRTQWFRLFTLSACLLAVVPVKCNSILAKRNPEVDDGYEYITVSSSRVPQRVKKGSQAVTASPEDVASGEALRNILLHNQRTEHIPGGGG